jgi:hypothetical protein
MSRAHPLTLLALALVACAADENKHIEHAEAGRSAAVVAAPPSADPPPRPEPATLPTASAPQQGLPGCPKTYAEAEAMRYCGNTPTSWTETLGCTYPEGVCVCQPARACGGAPVPTDTPGNVVCTPKHRKDGCPDQVPAEGSACDAKDKTCSYDLCGYDEKMNRKCDGRRWARFRFPPRP